LVWMVNQTKLFSSISKDYYFDKAVIEESKIGNNNPWYAFVPSP
jgi:hypothetical protein